jgi:hypothetical protein
MYVNITTNPFIQLIYINLKQEKRNIFNLFLLDFVNFQTQLWQVLEFFKFVLYFFPFQKKYFL